MNVVKSSSLLPDGGCSLLVHGGAWAIPDAELSDYRRGMTLAVHVGRAALLEGAAAIEVVTAVVAEMENSGCFDAGRGSVLTADGGVELDAGTMDGQTLAWGAVAAVRRIANPILVARDLALGDGQARLLVGEGAERFAADNGLELVDNAELVCEREVVRLGRIRERAHYHTSDTFVRDDAPQGTVGCVARDLDGRLASATSTGGTPNRITGRVGDSPLPGCGFYATPNAAASATGWGEAIATVLLCAGAVNSVARGTEVRDAAIESIRDMKERVRSPDGTGAAGGIILLDASGRGAVAWSSPRMARGGWSEGGEPWVVVGE